MILISNNQYNLFKDQKIERFINSLIDFLIEKQVETVIETDKKEIIITMQYIINWAIKKNIVKLMNLEYLICLYYKYQLTFDYLNNNSEIQNITNYVDRKEDDMLFLIHYYLKYNKKYAL